MSLAPISKALDGILSLLYSICVLVVPKSTANTNSLFPTAGLRIGIKTPTFEPIANSNLSNDFFSMMYDSTPEFLLFFGV